MRYIIALGLMVIVSLAYALDGDEYIEAQHKPIEEIQTQKPKIQKHLALQKVYDSTIQLHSFHGWSGSGAHIGNNRILTAYHVVGGMDEVVYIGEGDGKVLFKVVKGSEELDLAIIEPINQDIDLRLPVLKISDKAPKLGDKVWACGYNFGYGDGKTISEGFISGKIDSEEKNEQFLWFSSPANPGCSGGPVINENYEIVGVVQIGLARIYAGVVGMTYHENFLEFVK